MFLTFVNMDSAEIVIKFRPSYRISTTNIKSIVPDSICLKGNTVSEVNVNYEWQGVDGCRLDCNVGFNDAVLLGDLYRNDSLIEERYVFQCDSVKDGFFVNICETCNHELFDTLCTLFVP